MGVLLISGSPSATSRSTALLRHAQLTLEKNGVPVDWLVVRDLPAADLVHGRYDSEAIQQAAKQIANASAVVIATPIYKAAASGVLKAFLDLLPQNALEGKAVLPIGVGGSPAHLLAVDYSLKPVLTALGAQQQLPTLYATDPQIKLDDQGGAQLDNEIASRLQHHVRHLAHLYASAKANERKDKRWADLRLNSAAA